MAFWASGRRFLKYRHIRLSKRIVILCEGETDVLAVNHFIRRQWENDGLKSIGLHADNLQAKLEEVFVKVPLYLKNPKVIAVFTLIDLHKMNRFIQGPYSSIEENIQKARNWLKNQFSSDILAKFYPHLSVHEVEAWILAEGISLEKRLKTSISIENNAEEIDDQNPPKSRMNSIFHKCGKREGFKEIRDGTPLFQSLDFHKVYQKCPYFRHFYDELKETGTTAL
jgi:hypothetical protein